MNKGTNNEIDLLLRKLGHRERLPLLPDSAAIEDEGHLDADELNAYAENSLPPGARALYTEHVADCVECRRLVAQLSLASGAAVAQKQSVPERPSALRMVLAHIFSPLTWRYAIPTVAAIAILVVAVVVMRRQTTSDMVALNEKPIARETAHSSENASEPAIQQKGAADAAQPSASQPVSAPAKRSFSPVPAEEQPVVSTNDSRRQGEEPKKDESAKISAAAAPPPPAPASTGPTVAAKPAVAADSVAASSEVAQRKKQSANEPEAAGEEDRSAAKVPERKVEAGNVAKAPEREAQALGRPGGLRGDVTVGGASRARGAKENAEKDTRNIAGHRFRKQGSSWVDVNYNPGRTTINIRRGSEQYRALVADEPGIRTIADELDGEFIVVWKSRAYRIN